MQGKDIIKLGLKDGQILMAIRENVHVAKTAKAQANVEWNEVEQVRIVNERRYAVDRPVYKMWQEKPVDLWDTTTANAYGYLIQSVSHPERYRVVRSSDIIGTKASLQEELDRKQKVKEQWEAERKELAKKQEMLRQQGQERVHAFNDSTRKALEELLGEDTAVRTTYGVSYRLNDQMIPELYGQIGISVEDWQRVLFLLMSAKQLQKSDA